MKDAVEIRTISPTRHEIWISDNLVDFAPTEPDAQIMKAKHIARLNHEALINERNELKEVISILQEEIAGYHKRIGDIDRATA